MRIKKTSQTTPVQAQVVNTQSNSTQDSYSCDYINNAVKEVYSTNEQVIGTWINGKPLYRKVIEFYWSSNDWLNELNGFRTTTSNIITNINEIDILFLKTWHLSADNINLPSKPSKMNDSYYGQIYEFNDTEISMVVGLLQNANTFNNVKNTIIIEYTKTTD